MVALSGDWTDEAFVNLAIDMAQYDPVVAEYLKHLNNRIGLLSFRPRPDDIDEGDQQESFCRNKDFVSFLVGGNACLSEGTLVDTECGPTAIADLEKSGFIAESYGSRQAVSTRSWRKTRKQNLLRVVLSNGQEFSGSSEHRVLSVSESGHLCRELVWKRLCELSPGDLLLSSPSPCRTLGCESQTGWLSRHGRRCSRKPLGFLESCSGGRRLCGEQLLFWRGNGEASVPQLGDALVRILENRGEGGLFSKEGHSHLFQSFFRPSISWSLLHNDDLCGECSPGESTRCGPLGPMGYRNDSASESRGSSAKSLVQEVRQSHRGSYRLYATPEFVLKARDNGSSDSSTSLSDGGTLQVTAIEKCGQGWVWTCHVPVTNNYSACGVYHHNSGTTTAAAYKAARYLLIDQPPPRKDTPFWIISNTMDNTCNVCWGEKLSGMGFIPSCEVEGIAYHSELRNQPSMVKLKPWPEERGGDPDKNWVIEFKTYKQAWGALMGASIGGFWFSETFPSLLFSEVMVRCRDYFHLVGGRFAEFTPLDPWLSLEIQKMLERSPKDLWKIYHCNTLKNIPYLGEGGEEWLASMKASTPPELHATRIYGVFAAFQDQVFPTFSEAKHMVDEAEVCDRILSDNSLIHAMGTDWGAGNEHPHVTLWACLDMDADTWYIYDEYWNASQAATPDDHIRETLDRCESWGWPVIETENGRRIDLKQRYGYGMNHADSENTQMIRLYSTHGIPTTAYRKTPGSIEEGITYIKWRLGDSPTTGHPRLLISSRCKHMLEEMMLYRRKRGQTNMLALNPALARDVPLDRWNHTIDAARYVIRGYQQYEGYEPPRAVSQAHSRANRNAAMVHRHVHSARGSVPLARNSR